MTTVTVTGTVVDEEGLPAAGLATFYPPRDLAASGTTAVQANITAGAFSASIAALDDDTRPRSPWTVEIDLPRGGPAGDVRVSAALRPSKGKTSVNVLDIAQNPSAGFLRHVLRGVTAATAVTVASNAGTVPVTASVANFVNSSAATMTVTLATSGAVDGQQSIVRVYDFSAAAQTIAWVGTENSTVSAPTTSAGSTTLPKTVTFLFNAATSKWRCIASV